MLTALVKAAGGSARAQNAAKGAEWLGAKLGVDPESWLDNYLNPDMQLSPTLSINGTLADFAAERYPFAFQIIAPSDKDIRALDDFFESYGYRVDTFAKPNLALRGTFTYVKTRDAVVYSSNAGAAQQMQALLNTGCKFWKTEIGK